MLVEGNNLTTIWYEKNNDNIKIIDQRLLPYKLKIIQLKSLSDVIFAIKQMQVRGAPLIGVTAAYGMYLASKKKSNLDYLIKSANQLKKTRKYGIISFREKNLINLHKLNKKLPLGLLFNATAKFKTIQSKALKKYVKFLVFEKKFLTNKKIGLIKKKNYYYTIKKKDLFEKYKKSKNLIFENL